MLEYEVDYSDKGDANGSTHLVDIHFSVPITQTPRVSKALADTNEKLCHVTQKKVNTLSTIYRQTQ